MDFTIVLNEQLCYNTIKDIQVRLRHIHRARLIPIMIKENTL